MLKCRKCGNVGGFMKISCTDVWQRHITETEAAKRLGIKSETLTNTYEVIICEECKSHDVEEAK